MNFLFRFVNLVTMFLFATLYVEGQNLQVRAVFFNVENYFDPFDDPSRADEAFTPEGSYHWTWNKFVTKRNAIAKVIVAVGQGKAPALVGLCEVENGIVLRQLVRESPLARFNYKFVHRDSPDMRGIDVALLYSNDFKLIDTSFHEISNKFRTREILYAKGILANADTLHVFVVHFPSKFGGAKETEERRELAATKIKHLSDSIMSTNLSTNILIMGDFNDTPDSKPISALSASADFKNIETTTLYNLALPLARVGEGSIKFQGTWDFIDLMFINGNLLNVDNKIHCQQSDFKIFKADFLFEEDKQFSGKKPRRTFIGMKHNSGVSDHLPVFLDLKINNSSLQQNE